MIGSRVTVDVTVDVPRERRQLGRLVKCLDSAAGFSFPSLPLPPATNFFVTSALCLARLPLA